jgi:signal transduction histidine kinase
LAAVRRIIDAHGGRIWVHTGPGRGCAFHFTFPLET